MVRIHDRNRTGEEDTVEAIQSEKQVEFDVSDVQAGKIDEITGSEHDVFDFATELGRDISYE